MSARFEITPKGRAAIEAMRAEQPVLHVAGGRASGFVAHAIKAHADKTGARVVGRLDL